MFGLPLWAVIALLNLSACLAYALYALDEVTTATSSRATRAAVVLVLVVVGATFGAGVVGFLVVLEIRAALERRRERALRRAQRAADAARRSA